MFYFISQLDKQKKISPDMKRKKYYNDFLIQIIKFETRTVCRIDKTSSLI